MAFSENETSRSLQIEKELNEFGSYASNTVGVSMRPLFKTHRDVVILKKPDRPLKRYDVVMYVGVGDKYVLHRIIGFKGDICVIRGDNTFRKEFVPKDKIIAYMTSFNRKGKRHTTEEFSYRLYSRVWNFIYPLRKCWNLFYRFMLKIKRALFKNRKSI